LDSLPGHVQNARLKSVKDYGLLRKTAYRVTRFLVYAFFKIYYLMKVKGLENLPKEGGYILAVNHQSFLDPLVAGCAVPHYICFMARNTLWRSRFFSLVDVIYRNLVPLRRGTADKTALRNAVSRLERGWVILIFPEGTRTFDGRLGAIKKGPAFIAEKAGAPIVPAVLKGAYEIWPRTRKIPRLLGWPFHRLEVRYGAPIFPADFGECEGREKRRLMTEVLEERLRRLYEE